MGKINMKAIMTGFKNGFVRYSPDILVGLGIAGMFGAGVLAVSVTKKAIVKIEDKKEELGVEKLSVKETVKATWKLYTPPIVIGMVGASCVIFASAIKDKRNAALMTAYSISEAALKEYRNAVIETVGEKKEQVIREKVAENRVKENPVSDDCIIDTRTGHTLCYDLWTGRYFYSDQEAIRRAENMVNKLMIGEYTASLNDFYYELGLPLVKVADDIGWDANCYLCEVEFSSQLTSDGRPCLTVGFSQPPKYGYRL